MTPTLTSIILYRNEPVSNTLLALGYTQSAITFAAQTRMSGLPYTVPVLPSSTLTLTNPSSDGRTFLLAGTPTLLSASSNYYIVASNTTNGYVATTQFGIQVAAERLWITSTVPTTVSGSSFSVTSPIVLTLATPYTTSPTFTVLAPYTAVSGITFTSSTLPPGLTLSTANSTFTLVGTPTVGLSSYTTVITASTFGLSALSATITLTFNYTSTILFSPMTFNNYSNITTSNQLVATVFPSSALVTFRSTNLPSGFTLSSAGLLVGKTTTANTYAYVTASSAGLADSVLTMITLQPRDVPITITSSSRLSNYYVGQTPPTLTLTFASDAYPSGAFIATNGVTFANLPTDFTSTWVYPALTATVKGTVRTAGNSSFSVTVTTVDGRSVTTAIGYLFLADSCAITTVTRSPFSWTQNKLIDTIAFSGTPVSGLPITYYYGDSLLPPGLSMGPGGVLHGIPTTPMTTTTTLAGIYGTTGDKFSTFPVSGVYSYTVAADTVHLVTTPAAISILPTTSISIPLTYQTVSGVTLCNVNMTPMSYSYGLVLSPNSITGVLQSCVYPTGIILPASFVVSGTFAPNSVTGLIGLSNANPQTINRFLIGQTAGGYTVYCDNGSMNTFSTVFTLAGSPLPGPHCFQILSSNPSSTSLSAWSGTMVIVNGTTSLNVSTNMGTWNVRSVGQLIYYSTYSSRLSSWIALSADKLYFSASDWTSYTSVQLSGSIPDESSPYGHAVSGYVVQTFNEFILIGGAVNIEECSLVFATLPSSIPTQDVRFSHVMGNTLASIYVMAASSSIIVAGGVGGLSYSMGEMSDDMMMWTTVATITVTDVVYGGPLVDNWMALGDTGVVWSDDGMAWTVIPFIGLGTRLGPLQFDGTYWMFFSWSETGYTQYYHDALASTMTDITTWMSKPITFTNPPTRLFAFPTPVYTMTGTPQPALFTGATTGGPTFTAPTVTSYALFQYVPMADIKCVATGSPVYFLGSDLPHGMTWDSTTATLKGLSVQLGTFNVIVYAQTSFGSSTLTLQFVVSRIEITRTMPNAAAYTSFIREKVEADAATSAVNNHATAFEVGPFLLERPPVITTAPEICCDPVKNVSK